MRNLYLQCLLQQQNLLKLRLQILPVHQRNLNRLDMTQKQKRQVGDGKSVKILF